MIPRHVQTIFCDDIRNEEGGKMSLIGVYSTEMYVNKFPAVLPKLGVVIKVISPALDPLSSLTIRILKDDEVIQEVAVGDEHLKDASEAIEGNVTENKIQLAQFAVMFSPLILDEPCKLKVRVQTECEELRGQGLKICTNPSEDTYPLQLDTPEPA